MWKSQRIRLRVEMERLTPANLTCVCERERECMCECAYVCVSECVCVCVCMYLRASFLRAVKLWRVCMLSYLQHLCFKILIYDSAHAALTEE